MSILEVRPLQPDDRSPKQRQLDEDLRAMQLQLERKSQSLLDRAQYHLWRTRTSYDHPLSPSDRRAMQLLKNLAQGLTWNFLVTPWDFEEDIKRRVRL